MNATNENEMYDEFITNRDRIFNECYVIATNEFNLIIEIGANDSPE